MTPFVIGIAGGTASGKTTLAHQLFAQYGSEKAGLITLDSYYRCHGHLAPDERAEVNYDHPGAFDIVLLNQQLASLGQGKAIEMPAYDFSTHSRRSERIPCTPRELCIVEGILTFHWAELRELLSYFVFVDAPSAIRFERRRVRDVTERGRTDESVRKQWESTVQPMHEQFCEPTRGYANLVVDGCQPFETTVDMLTRTFADHYEKFVKTN